MTDYTQLAKEWLRKYDDLYDPQVNDLAALLARVAADERERCWNAIDYMFFGLLNGSRGRAELEAAIRAQKGQL